LPTSKRSQKF